MFQALFGGIRDNVGYMRHLVLVGKLVVDCLLMLTELSTLFLTPGALQMENGKSVDVGFFEGGGSLWA